MSQPFPPAGQENSVPPMSIPPQQPVAPQQGYATQPVYQPNVGYAPAAPAGPKFFSAEYWLPKLSALAIFALCLYSVIGLYNAIMNWIPSEYAKFTAADFFSGLFSLARNFFIGLVFAVAILGFGRLIDYVRDIRDGSKS